MDMITNITKRYIGTLTGRSMIYHVNNISTPADVVDFKKTLNWLPFIEVVSFCWADLRQI
jgi:hypothetical protein